MQTNIQRVGIRGVGLLAWRLMLALNGNHRSTINVHAALYRCDPTLEQFLQRFRIGKFSKGILPRENFIAGSEEDLRHANEMADGLISFRSAKELCFEGSVNAVIDTAPVANNSSGGKGGIDQFSGPIILQDGAYPQGRLILPPSRAPGNGNRHRLGGCILSGVVPVMAAFQRELRACRLHVVMQNDKRDNDFLIRERLTSLAFEPAYPARLDEELSALMPEVQFDTVSVTQIPGLLHYGLTLDLELSSMPSMDEVFSRLDGMPHVRVLPKGVTSTYQVNMVEREGIAIPPIMVIRDSVRVKGNSLRLFVALGYRTVTVLPNIDTLRVVLKDMDPMDAMRETDCELGLSS